jgi:hypothetical protein
MTDKYPSKLEVNTKSEPSPSTQESVEESSGGRVRRSQRTTAIKNRLKQLSTKTLEIKQKIEKISEKQRTDRRLAKIANLESELIATDKEFFDTFDKSAIPDSVFDKKLKNVEKEIETDRNRRKNGWR